MERYRDDIRKQIPEVDAVIGTNELDAISALCEGIASALDPLEPYLYHDVTPRLLATPRHFAYIKITEGCDHPCTFCVIPQYRGQFRSRRFESVVAEAPRMFDAGVREINLIGQDTTAYGDDLGIRTGWRAARTAGANRDGAAGVDPVPVLLSQSHHARLLDTMRATGAGEIHRHAAAACLARRC